MILCIETATKNCSVAIVSDSRVIAQSAERADKFVHGERLHLNCARMHADGWSRFFRYSRGVRW